MCLKERTKNKIEQKLYALNSLKYWRHGNLYKTVQRTLNIAHVVRIIIRFTGP